MVSSSTELVTGDGRTVTVADISKLYRNGSSLASPSSSGKIQLLGENAYSLTSVFNSTDLDTLETTKTFKVYSLSTSTNSNLGRCIESVRCVSDSHRVVDLALATSENGRFLARLRAPSNGKDSSSASTSKKQLLEIWDRSRHLKTIDISELDAHGPINTDPQFSSFQWSPFGEQDRLLYVCQRKQQKYPNFFKQERSGQSAECGEEYNHKEDWGECLNEIVHTVVAILDVSNDCQIVTIDVDKFSLGDSKFMDNGSKIISVAYPEEPRRLGLIYCNNRASRIVVHDWLQTPPQQVLNLSSDSHCFHTPRVDHSGEKFVFLSNPTFGPHRHAVRLNIYDIKTNEHHELVDKSTQEADLFIEDLPRNCFSEDDKHILFIKSDHLFHHMCLFSFENSRISNVKFPTTGVSIQDFRYNIILATGSEVDASPTLFVAVLSSTNTGELVVWHQIEDCIHLDELKYEPHKITTPDGNSFVSALLVSPNLTVLQKNFVNRSNQSSNLIRDDTQLPTVVIVHGGPHAAFALYYMPTVAFYSRLGLKTLLINYRGSLGVSEEYVQTLCGHIGKLDVDDCLHVIRYFVHNKTIDPKKLIIQGGSHGGFLSCHLSCQEEFKFTSAIIRNPVVSISSMHETSDIPDWAYTEALGHKQFDFKWMPNDQELAKMYNCSPIAKYNKANVPTLMHLGTKDQRVKMYQGLRWVELLKARGVETTCKVYQDKHDLAKAEVAADSTMSAAVWILTHLNPPN